MPTKTKVSTAVKRAVKQPIEAIKKGAKAVSKPASDSTTVGEVAIGSVLALPAGYLYSKAWDKLVTLIPESWKANETVLKIIKIVTPLTPMYPIYHFKVPYGSLLNGLLLGISVTQIGIEIYNYFKGTKTTSTETAVVGDLELETGYAEFD